MSRPRFSARISFSQLEPCIFLKKNYLQICTGNIIAQENSITVHIRGGKSVITHAWVNVVDFTTH